MLILLGTDWDGIVFLGKVLWYGSRSFDTFHPSIFITQKGKNKLHDLEKKYKNKTIGTLEQYKIKKMELEEIYLP